MGSDAASPRPWKIVQCGYGPIIYDANGVIVARVDWDRDETDEANAELIVRAVNASGDGK